MLLNHKRYPENMEIPSIMTFIALVSGYIFFLTIFTMAMRIISKKGVPA
jgi:hypothetical protein